MRLLNLKARNSVRVMPLMLASLSTLLCTAAIVRPVRAGAQAAEPPARKTETPPVSPIIGEDLIDPKQALKPSFVINVSVANEPEPSGTYVIDAAGNISLHIAEVLFPVPLNGLTAARSADVIATLLKKYIKDPQVTVSIVSVPRSTITVGGAVRTSGAVVIAATTSLIDVLSRAEWLETADLSQVRVIRREMVNGQERRSILTLHVDTYIRPDANKGLDESQNPVLHDKDTIFVPFKNLPSKGAVTVAGEVVHPITSLPLRANSPLTLREAINLAGGLSPAGNRRAITVRRANSPTLLVLDLDKAEQNLATDNIELQPDDAIYVERVKLSDYVNVVGAVAKAGKLNYEKKMTLTDAVMEAGGLLPIAKEKEGFILRRAEGEGKKSTIVTFNWRNVVTGKSPDILLQPGDSIWVPASIQSGQSRDFLSVLAGLTPLGLFLPGRR